MRCRRTFGMIGLAGLFAGLAIAQEPPTTLPPTGPAAVPGTFRSFLVVDDRTPKTDVRNRAGKMHCLVVENGLSPVTAVFTRTDPAKVVGTPLEGLLKQLNDSVAKNRATNAAAFAVFLTLEKEYPLEDREVEAKDKDDNPIKAPIRPLLVKAVADLAGQLKLPNIPFGLASGAVEEKDKPGQLTAWGIKDEDETVVVVYHRMKVVKRWAFTATKPPTDADVKDILDTYLKEAKGG